MSEFEKELKDLLNKHCQENKSGTPGFIFAGYIINCMAAFDSAVMKREDWYGRKPEK